MRLLDLDFQKMSPYKFNCYLARNGAFDYHWLPDYLLLSIWLGGKVRNIKLKEPLLTLFRIKYP